MEITGERVGPTDFKLQYSEWKRSRPEEVCPPASPDAFKPQNIMAGLRQLWGRWEEYTHPLRSDASTPRRFETSVRSKKATLPPTPAGLLVVRSGMWQR